MKSINNFLLITLLVISTSCIFFQRKDSNNGLVKTKGYYIIENIESFRDSLLTDACIIEGFVYDARTSETLSHGTAITYNGNNNPVIIDKNGFFRYVLKPSTYQIRFIRAGYYDLITDSLELSLNEKIILSVFLGSSVVY